MLAVGRRLHEARAQLVVGDWSIPLATELYRKTVGVVGLGRIGRGVVRRLRGFEARVLIATPERDEAFAAEQGARFASLDELLACADIVSLHAPLTPATHSLIDRTRGHTHRRGRPRGRRRQAHRSITPSPARTPIASSTWRQCLRSVSASGASALWSLFSRLLKTGD